MISRRVLPFVLALAFFGACCGESATETATQRASLSSGRIWTRLYTGQPGKLRHHLVRDGYEVTGSHHRLGFVDLLAGNEKRDDALQRYSGLISSVEMLDTERAARALEDYYSPAEVEAFLDQVVTNYPAIAQKVLLRDDLPEGHLIWAMKISDNVSVDEDEPTYLMDGHIHAREVMTVEVMVDAIDYLTSNYGSDTQVTRWVDEMEIWIVPVVNPDGAHYMYTVDQWWRKNRNTDCATGDGVDLNRNFEWNYRRCAGSSDNCSDDTYHGSGPASEVETQAMQELMEQVRPLYYINYHSYGEYIIWPTGCGRTDEQDLLAYVGQALNQRVETDDGQTGNWTIGTAPDILYSAPGGSDDTAYGAFGAVSFTFELNSTSFWPDYDTWRDATVQRQRAAWGHLLDRTLDEPAVTGHTYDANTLDPVVADYQYANHPFTSGQWPLHTDVYGRFGRPVLPDSDHLLIFTAAGYLPESRQVHVGSEQVDLDVPMTAGVNHAPTADAGPDQQVDEGDPVTLDGTGSSDPDGNDLLYDWVQISGQQVSLQDAHTANPTFEAPYVAAQDEVVFELTVSDGELVSAADSVTVQVEDVYPSATYYPDDTPIVIPDDDDNGIQSVITVNGECIIIQASVGVDITHTYIGDLVISVESPVGTQVVLHDHEGGSTHDLHEVYPVSDFNGEDAAVDWTLRVIDEWAGDEGTLDSWSLTVECEQTSECEVPGDCDLPNVDQHDCIDGQCVIVSCDAGYADCNITDDDGCEVHTDTDVQSCGGCGTVCSFEHASASCVAGECVMGACDESWDDCDGDPDTGCEADLLTSLAHCGACDSPCAFDNAQAICNGGVCNMGSCDENWGDCDEDPDTGCETDISSEIDHCGACDHGCSFEHASGACTDGACVLDACEENWGNCDENPDNGCETGLLTSLGHCGACDSPCTFENAQAMCDAGVCSMGPCDENWGDCDEDPDTGCETDLSTSLDHCGACDHACSFDHASGSCSAGSCVLDSCDENWGNCDGNPDNGCETDLRGNIEHCLACGNGCEYEHAAALCTAEGCEMGSCDSNWADCDASPSNGCEVNLLEDPAHCGSCDTACAFEHAAAGCAGGECVMGECDDGYADCDGLEDNGCETALGTDSNCSACGDDCSAAFDKASGTCDPGSGCVMGACDAGYGDCNSNPDDGCEASLSESSNCGACGNACSETETCVDTGNGYECSETCLDSDEDGYADDSCGGTDCDDDDEYVYPGAFELCDEKDNDCDEETDEDYTSLGESCDSEEDADSCDNGVWACNTAGDGVVCTGDEASPEMCSGEDDDCDGLTDEEWPELGEECDGDDEDECAEGTFVCNQAGDGVTCQEEGPGHTETCNSQDDDCDGLTDEDGVCDEEEEDEPGGCGCSSGGGAQPGLLLFLLLLFRRPRRSGPRGTRSGDG